MESAAQNNSNLVFKEIIIRVPWGAINAKTLGNESSAPLLFLHGIQDNACSFDLLISLLPRDFYFVCVDLPGHGKSKSFCEGLILELTDYVLAVKRVFNFFGWNKCTIIGHSLGAQLALFFSSIYPEHVVKIIMIDGLTPLVIPAENTLDHFRQCVKEVQKVQDTLNNKKPPSYTYEEALDRMKTRRHNPINDTPARLLLNRSLVESGSGFRFATDQRLKYFIKPLYTYDHIRDFVERVTCPVLLIIAEETTNYYKEIVGEMFHEILNKMFFVKPNVRAVVVSGGHNVHMNHPQRVAGHVIPFLLQKCSL